MAFSVGDDSRREFLIIGETIQQVSDTMHYAKDGEVIISAEGYSLLNEAAFVINPSVFDDDGSRPQVIASKKEQYFKAKVDSDHAKKVNSDEVDEKLSKRCQSWNTPALERLLSRMSSYVHPAVLLTGDLATAEGTSGTTINNTKIDATTMNRRGSIISASSTGTSSRRSSVNSTHANNKNIKSRDAELREVFTAFIQPDVDTKKIMGNHTELETIELLNQLMLIINSEVCRFKGHLRQFVVDDKGKVGRDPVVVTSIEKKVLLTAFCILYFPHP
jgi:hypothetical protein